MVAPRTLHDVALKIVLLKKITFHFPASLDCIFSVRRRRVIPQNEVFSKACETLVNPPFSP
jgi:hypothetical protein